MINRKGLMSIGIALIMLIFSLIVAMVITNISSNLYKNIIRIDERKESQYKRVVIMSLKNTTDYINEDVQKPQSYFNNLTEAERTIPFDDFNFFYSDPLFQETINFPATVTVAATYVTTTEDEDTAKLNFFELYTLPDLEGAGFDYTEDEYGIIIQYESNE